MLIGAVIAWEVAPGWLAAHGYIGEHAKRTKILLVVMWPGIAVFIAGEAIVAVIIPILVTLGLMKLAG
jgi:hypothetical protein